MLRAWREWTRFGSLRNGWMRGEVTVRLWCELCYILEACVASLLVFVSGRDLNSWPLLLSSPFNHQAKPYNSFVLNLMCLFQKPDINLMRKSCWSIIIWVSEGRLLLLDRTKKQMSYCGTLKKSLPLVT